MVQYHLNTHILKKSNKENDVLWDMKYCLKQYCLDLGCKIVLSVASLSLRGLCLCQGWVFFKYNI